MLGEKYMKATLGLSFNMEKIEAAYIRLNQLTNSLSYRKQTNREKVKVNGQDEERVTFEVRSNSRVIISNLKDEADADQLVLTLQDGVATLLNNEFERFRKSIE